MKAKQLTKRLTVDATVHPENYLSMGLATVPIGTNSLAGTPSWSVNDYILNNAAHIASGTGTNLRLGRHVFFTFLRLRFYVSTYPGRRVRIVVGKSQDQDDMARLVTGATLGAKIESDVFEAPILSGGGVNVESMMFAPSTEYTILYDKVCGYGTDVAPANGTGYVSTLVTVSIPLYLQRNYDINGLPDCGDWFIHMCSSGADCYVTGTMRLDFINQWDWESIPRAIKTSITYADDILQHAAKSTAVRSVLGLLKLAG